MGTNPQGVTKDARNHPGYELSASHIVQETTMYSQTTLLNVIFVIAD